MPIKVLYVPKGPLCDWNNLVLRRRVLKDLIDLAKDQKAIFIKIDPDVCLGIGIPGRPEEQEDALGKEIIQELHNSGWHFSSEQVQFRNTVMVDLTPGLDSLLAVMKQKTRYNIRIAERKGVTIRKGTQSELTSLYRMYAETSVRDGFVIREENYYLKLWSTFIQDGLAESLIAEVAGEMIAALLIFRFGEKAWYLFGMSHPSHREKMPNYLLQWEAIKRAKAEGCKYYDLWGAPDAFNERDPLYGVFRFKEGFGGVIVRHIGAWDYPVQPIAYRFYTRILPYVLGFLRQRGRDRVKDMKS